MLRHHQFLPSGLLILAIVGVPACSSRTVDVTKALQVTDVTSGYFDAGIVEGNKNKIVPTISVRLKNNDSEPVASVQMIARFAVVDDPQELGSAPYVRAIGPEGLAPGKTSGAVVMKSDRGYTSEAPRAQMFTHSVFKDVRVELFAKYRAQTWVKMGEYRISRQLLTR